MERVSVISGNLRQVGREGRSSTEGLIVYRVQSLLQELRGRSNRRL